MSSDNFDATVCTQEQLENSGASGFYCYTRRQNVGLVVVSMVGFLSLTSVVSMLGLIVRNVLRNRNSANDKKRRLIEVPMDLFVLSLFVADLFQSLGVVMDVRWINDGISQQGGLCNAQGVLQNIGQAGIAMTTFIITLHTFDSIWRHGGVKSLRWAYILIGTVWAFLILAIAISISVKTDPPFYAPTPYWCWINSNYPNYRIALENFWLWIGFAVSVLYIPLLFWDTGRVTPGDPKWWTFKLNSGDARSGQRRSKLIICALAYCLPVLPTSLARWFLVVHGDVKPFATAEAQFLVKGIFSMSGVCDVVAFKFARSGLLLFSSDAKEESEAESDKAEDASEFSLDNMDRGGSSYTQSVADASSRRSWRFIALFSTWIAVNVLDAVWITYYIRAATDPNPRTAVNRSHAGWQVYYLIMYVFGFFWGCVNIVVWMWFFQNPSTPMRTRSVKESTRSQALHYSWRCFRILILVPISVVMGLGPFFGPVIGVKLAQEQAWLHRCDDFIVEVVLSGLSFNAPDNEAPIAMFYFRQPDGTLQQGPEYNLTNDPFNASIWNFMLSPGQPLVEGPSITYNVSNSTLDAICPDATSPCTTGSYQPNSNGHLFFSLTNSSTTVAMRAVDNQWVYDQSDDAPSFLLKEVQPNGSLGKVVVRTAVTQPGHCTNLKLCANDASIETLAPVGLTLMKQNQYARVCTTPNSN